MRLISSVRRLNLPTSRKRLSVGSERFMNGFVPGAVLKPDLLLLPLHWKKRLPKAAGPMSGAETRSFLFSFVPSVEERREVLTGAAGMIARGRSLFPFG